MACVHCGLPVPRSRGGIETTRFCCLGCRVAFELTRPVDDGHGPPAVATAQLRVGLGLFLAMNIMVFDGLFWAQEVFGDGARASGIYAELVDLIAYLQGFLGTLVLWLLGLPIFVDAWERLRGEGPGVGRVDANLLIGVGVLAAWTLSAVNVVRGDSRLYFATAAMILVAVTLGQLLEASAKRRAAASAGELLSELPAKVRVVRDGGESCIPIDDLGAGDRFLLAEGESLAADGIVVRGEGRLDESSLTGEAQPREVARGELVLAGAVLTRGGLTVEARQVGSARVIAGMQRMLDAARREQPPIQRVADRIAGWFVPTVVVIALVTLAIHAFLGAPLDGLWAALSVLLISCPCALGLAAPLASWHALGRAARHGILIDSASTLERLARVRRLFLDKTGTLTLVSLELDDIDVVEGLGRDRALALAAAVDAASRHPVACALTEAARQRGLAVPEARSVIQETGFGVSARVGERALAVGGPRMLERERVRLDPTWPSADSASVVLFLIEGERALARFRLVERIREEAPRAIASLTGLGLSPTLLTGDRPERARRVGETLGIPWRASMLPTDKVRAVREGHGADGSTMVGDGVNDAPVLAAADVGIALGSASDLTARAGNVRLASDRLDRLPAVISLSRHAHARIRACLAWAFVFNGVGVCLAAVGLLGPVFAALAMLVSSLTVILLASGAGKPVGAEDRATAGIRSTPSSAGLSTAAPAGG